MNDLASWVLVALAAGLLLLAGCTPASVEDAEDIANIATIRAGTPSPTPTASPTPTETTTPPPPPTITPTSPPSPTPLPPTPTPNPALSGFSYCTQQTALADGGRFSAELTDVTSESFPAFERLIFDFELAPDSAAFSAITRCLSERDFVLATDAPAAPGSYVLQIQLPDWLRDEQFSSSVLSETFAFTNTTVATTAQLRNDEQRPAGAAIVVGLEEPVVYRLDFNRDESRLLVEVARTSSIIETSDQLSLPLGTVPAVPDEPLFFLLGGDIWRADATGVISLTQTLEAETALAVSPDGTQLAFCRTQDPASTLAGRSTGVPSALWLLDAEGGQERLVANVGVNCADPVFSPDGTQIAFSVDETGVSPPLRSIWVVPLQAPPATPTPEPAPEPVPETEPENASVPEEAATPAAGEEAASPPASTGARLIAGDGTWSRSAPQWLDEDTLVYAAMASDGRSTLFLRELIVDMNDEGVRLEDIEVDLGAELVVGDRYHALGAPLVAPNGRAMALEALRADGSGADMVLLDADGTEQDAISDGYWTRPLAWGPQGELYYMTTACESTLVNNYTLHRRSGGEDRLLMTGTTLGTFGQAHALGGGLAYVSGEQAVPGPRGPGQIAPQSPTQLWYWDLARGLRSVIYEAERDINGLAGPQ